MTDFKETLRNKKVLAAIFAGLVALAGLGYYYTFHEKTVTQNQGLMMTTTNAALLGYQEASNLESLVQSASMELYMNACNFPHNCGSDATTPLIQAVINNNIKLAEKLIEHKADVNAAGLYKPPALISAIASKNPSSKMVELLLKNGANPNVIFGGDKMKVSPLLLASANRDPKLNEEYLNIVNLLLAAGADPNLDLRPTPSPEPIPLPPPTNFMPNCMMHQNAPDNLTGHDATKAESNVRVPAHKPSRPRAAARASAARSAKR